MEIKIFNHTYVSLLSLMRASYPPIEISGDTIGKGRHVKVGRNSQ